MTPIHTPGNLPEVGDFPNVQLSMPTDRRSNFNNVNLIRSVEKLKLAGKGGVEGARHVDHTRNHHRRDRSHINKCTSRSTSSVNESKSSESDITLPPGTGVYYTPKRSINSKGYGKICRVEALSLLADVSCKLQCAHQRSCKMISKISETTAYQDRYTHQRSRKLIPTALENTYKIVKKLRTPRRTALNSVHQRSSNFQEHNLSNCDEIFLYNAADGSNLIFSQCLRGHARNEVYQPMADASAATFPDKGKSPEGARRSPSMVTTVTELAQPAQYATNIVRFSRPPSPVVIGRKEQSKEKRAQRYVRRILQFVGYTSISEKLIREALGNNPDTSKALRQLLAERKLKRLGDGGKGNAYVYVATTKGLLELQELEQTGELAGSTPDSEGASSCNPSTGRMCETNLCRSG